MKFDWKITDISAANDVITSAKYHVTATEGDVVVETEGFWTFAEPEGKVPFLDVTEEMVIGWIQNEAMRDGKHLITSRLEEQVNALLAYSVVVPPWMPQKFTPNI
jgi:hypothetical protein